jgi:rare lipoprotein A
MNVCLHPRNRAKAAVMASLALMLVALTGCGHRQPKPVDNAEEMAPPPQTYYRPQPQPQPYSPPSTYSSASRTSGSRIPVTPVPPGGVSTADLKYISAHEPILSETGFATWYTAPYKGRKAANGQVFDDHALTAAHRTLPMGSLVVVTNVKTGQASAMRITDRGPFVEGRVVDLTIASAKATGVYHVGLAKVRIDVYQTPKPIDIGGRWCVQIGAFRSEDEAMRLKQQLLHRYHSASVIEFPGENSYWVRIRPEGDDREMAEYIAKHLRPVQGEAFLTRLD